MTNTTPTSRNVADGIWIPLITPFKNNVLDEPSVRKMVRYYAHQDITGFILAGTTGESMTISEKETARLVAVVQEENAEKLPVYLGLSGSYTAELVEIIKQRNAWSIDGYLITAPYYTRPPQDGLYQHYMAAADASTLPIILYNIPYRTGVNVLNETVFKLAAHERIVAIKNCCAIAEQTDDLIRNAPQGFSVLVGDDANFFDNVSKGAKGGVLASAHAAPQTYVRVLSMLQKGETGAAQELWDAFAPCIPYLFKHPNPAPLKALLAHRGLIASDEVRLPLTIVPAELRSELISLFDKHPCP